MGWSFWGYPNPCLLNEEFRVRGYVDALLYLPGRGFFGVEIKTIGGTEFESRIILSSCLRRNCRSICRDFPTRPGISCATSYRENCETVEIPDSVPEKVLVRAVVKRKRGRGNPEEFTAQLSWW